MKFIKALSQPAEGHIGSELRKVEEIPVLRPLTCPMVVIEGKRIKQQRRPTRGGVANAEGGNHADSCLWKREGKFSKSKCFTTVLSATGKPLKISVLSSLWRSLGSWARVVSLGCCSIMVIEFKKADVKTVVGDGLLKATSQISYKWNKGVCWSRTDV